MCYYNIRKEVKMGISYDRLWKLLIDKKLNKGKLRKLANISTPSMARMGKNEYVSLEIIERICKALNCDISDIIEYVPDDNEKK